MSELGLPGQLSPSFSYLLQPTLSCAVALLIYSGGKKLDGFVAIFALVPLVIYAAAITAVSLNRRWRCVARPVNLNTRAPSVVSYFCDRVEWFPPGQTRRGRSATFSSTISFFSLPDVHFGQFRTVVEVYYANRQWYGVCDLLQSLAYGALGSYYPQEVSGCEAQQILVGCLTLLSLLSVTYFRPYNNRVDCANAVLSGTLNSVSCVLAVAGQDVASSQVACSAMFAMLILSVVPLLAGLLSGLGVRKAVRALRLWRRAGRCHPSDLTTAELLAQLHAEPNGKAGLQILITTICSEKS